MQSLPPTRLCTWATKTLEVVLTVPFILSLFLCKPGSASTEHPLRLAAGTTLVSVRTNKRASSSGGALADRSSVLCRSRPAAFACLHRLPACSRPRLPARPRCTDARPAHAQQACRRARYGGGAGGCAVLLGLPSYTNKEHVLGARCTRVQVSCISLIPHLRNLWEKGKIVVLCCCYVVGGAQGIF